MSRVLFGCAFVALIACTANDVRNVTYPASGATQGPAVACGHVTHLRPDPTQDGLPGLKLGPLWLHAFGSSARSARIDFVAGHPTKVLIEGEAGSASTVELRGSNCSSGRPLRFCYPPAVLTECGLLGAEGRSYDPATFERAGTAVQRLDASSGYPGYMLFPKPGLYEIWLTRSGGSPEPVARAVVAVR